MVDDAQIVWGTSDSSNLRASEGASGNMRFATNGTERMRITAAGLVYIGDAAASGNYGNANMTQGLTLNQAANDDQIFALKSSDVAHGMTVLAETDTYGLFRKWSGAEGGFYLEGLTEGETGMAVISRATTEVTTDTTASSSAWWLGVSKANGASYQDMGTTANLININNNGTTRVIVKGDGTVHASDTSWATALDDMPDALAGRAYTTEMALRQGNGLLGSLEVHAPELVQRMEDAGIVTHAELEGEGSIPGHRFLNLQKGIKFSWDMGFQNFSFLAEIAKVLSDEQRSALPSQMQEAFALLDDNRMEIN